MNTITKKIPNANLSRVKVYFLKKELNFSLKKIPINTGSVINKKVLIEKVNKCNSKVWLYKKLEKKLKYKGTYINDISANIDVKQIDNGTFPSAILVA